MKVKVTSNNERTECDVCEKVKNDVLSIYPTGRLGISINYCLDCQDDLARLIKFS